MDALYKTPLFTRNRHKNILFNITVILFNISGKFINPIVNYLIFPGKYKYK